MFESVKLYYGQAYEAITSNFTVLACLNNILNGRNFDEFRHLTLNKYIKDLQKSAKAGPFEQTQEFMAFTESLDSTLRNGSHHASIWRENEVIYFKSGGTGQKRNITYSRYLHVCNKITISLAALFLLEIHISTD